MSVSSGSHQIKGQVPRWRWKTSTKQSPSSKTKVPFAASPLRRPCCHMAVVQDPDGNKLIIHKLKPENEKGVCK